MTNRLIDHDGFQAQMKALEKKLEWVIEDDSDISELDAATMIVKLMMLLIPRLTGVVTRTNRTLMDILLVCSNRFELGVAETIGNVRRVFRDDFEPMINLCDRMLPPAGKAAGRTWIYLGCLYPLIEAVETLGPRATQKQISKLFESQGIDGPKTRRVICKHKKDAVWLISAIDRASARLQFLSSGPTLVRKTEG